MQTWFKNHPGFFVFLDWVLWFINWVLYLILWIGGIVLILRGIFIIESILALSITDTYSGQVIAEHGIVFYYALLGGYIKFVTGMILLPINGRLTSLQFIVIGGTVSFLTFLLVYPYAIWYFATYIGYIIGPIPGGGTYIILFYRWWILTRIVLLRALLLLIIHHLGASKALPLMALPFTGLFKIIYRDLLINGPVNRQTLWDRFKQIVEGIVEEAVVDYTVNAIEEGRRAVEGAKVFATERDLYLMKKLAITAANPEVYGSVASARAAEELMSAIQSGYPLALPGSLHETVYNEFIRLARSNGAVSNITICTGDESNLSARVSPVIRWWAFRDARVNGLTGEVAPLLERKTEFVDTAPFLSQGQIREVTTVSGSSSY